MLRIVVTRRAGLNKRPPCRRGSMGTNLFTRRVGAVSALLLATTAWPALAQTGGTPTRAESAAETQDTTQQAEPTQIDPADAAGEDIIVTGYRASLQSQTNAKRNSIGFT